MPPVRVSTGCSTLVKRIGSLVVVRVDRRCGRRPTRTYSCTPWTPFRRHSVSSYACEVKKQNEKKKINLHRSSKLNYFKLFWLEGKKINRKIEGDLHCPKTILFFDFTKKRERNNEFYEKKSNNRKKSNNFLDNLYRCQNFIRTKTHILSLSHTQSHTHLLSDPTPHPKEEEKKKMT